MFEIRCIVGDKKLHEVLRLLNAYTIEPPVVIPAGIIPVEKSNPNPHNEKTEGGSVALLRKFNSGRKTVTAKEMREHCERNGYSKNGYSYALKVLLTEGALKAVKNEYATYEVIRNG